MICGHRSDPGPGRDTLVVTSDQDAKTDVYFEVHFVESTSTQIFRRLVTAAAAAAGAGAAGVIPGLFRHRYLEPKLSG